jgi:hypothetical protein
VDVREALDAGEASLQDAVIVGRPAVLTRYALLRVPVRAGYRETRSERNASAATKIFAARH